MNKRVKSDRQKRLDKHHGFQKRVKQQKMFAIIGSIVVVSIPVYILYFS